MSEPRAIRDIWINVDKQRFVDSTGGQVSSPDRFTLTRNTDTVVRCRLFENDMETTFKPTSGSTWYFAVDNSFSPSGADPVVSLDAEFNIVGDWDDLSVDDGMISWRINTATTNLLAKFTALSDPASLNMTAELWMTSPTAARSTLLCQWECVIKNIVGDIDTDTTLESTSNNIIVWDVANNQTKIMLPDGSVAQTWGPQ